MKNPICIYCKKNNCRMSQKPCKYCFRFTFDYYDSDFFIPNKKFSKLLDSFTSLDFLKSK